MTSIETPHDPDKVKILLVDDQPGKLLSYETILRDLGQNLIKARSGREALEHLLKGDIGVVLMDVCMPELDGFELAAMVRQHPRCRKTSIIFVSAIHMSDFDQVKGYDFGAVDYVSVPVVPEILRARVAVFVELYRKEQQLERFNRDLERRVEERTAELAASNERLRSSEERLRLAMIGSGMGTWDVDLATDIAHLSERAFKMLGVEPPIDGLAPVEAIRRCIHPEDLPSVDRAVDRARARRAMFSADYRIVRADDAAHLWASAYGRFSYDNSGNAVRFAGVLFDVTERKAMEEHLRSADRRKDEFLAVLAHELRNPLNPIRSAASVLRMDASTPEEISWSRDVIDRQVDHLTRLVDDLLDVSRITTGKLTLRRERTALADIVRNAVEACRPVIGDRGHELHVKLPACPVFVDADAVRLSQVLVNLLNNAAKYTKPMGRIGLSAESAGGEIVIRVSDNGNGIEREKLPYLFDMFYQVRDNFESSRSGLGIGLTLVRQLVEMHGGRVEARSAGAGRGSEFIIHLPDRESAAHADMRQTPVVRTGAIPHELPRRILVVDDNQDSAESLSILLRIHGHDVRSAFDGHQALRHGGAFHPEVVILDLGMPVMNGFDVARAIRRESWGKQILLVALTGWGRDEDRRRVREAGFDAHLTKPLSYPELKKLVVETPTSA